MEETKKKVFMLIGEYGKMKVSEMLGISSITLARRIESNEWKKSEIALINQLSN